MGDYSDYLRSKGFRRATVERTTKQNGDWVLQNWDGPLTQYSEPRQKQPAAA